MYVCERLAILHQLCERQHVTIVDTHALDYALAVCAAQLIADGCAQPVIDGSFVAQSDSIADVESVDLCDRIFVCVAFNERLAVRLWQCQQQSIALQNTHVPDHTLAHGLAWRVANWDSHLTAVCAPIGFLQQLVDAKHLQQRIPITVSDALREHFIVSCGVF